MPISINNPAAPVEGSGTIWQKTALYAAAQTDAVLVAAPGAGLSLYITDIIISNGSTAGTAKLVEKTASSTDIVESLFLAINGGMSTNLQTPIKLTTNENLGFTSVTCTDHSVTVTGYTAP